MTTIKKNLIIKRPLINGNDIRKWAAKEGFTKALPAHDMHCTILYCRDHLLDWDTLGKPDHSTIHIDTIHSHPKYTFLMGSTYPQAVVLRFNSPYLVKRFHELQAKGAIHSHPDFKAHITVTYNQENYQGGGIGPGPYRGPLILGPEHWKEIEGTWDSSQVHEDPLGPIKESLHEIGSPFPVLSWNSFPKIGWWLDKDPVTFYHGTHKDNLTKIKKSGTILAPQQFADDHQWVSLALEPNTSYGYAAMSGMGGETGFRAAGAKVKNTPPSDRAVLVLEIPQDYFLPKMAPQRGAVEEYRDRLTNKRAYQMFKFKHPGVKTDQEWYTITEIRLPRSVPASFIKGVMYKI